MLKKSPITAVLPAEDVHRARRFYTEKLGLNEADMSVPDDSIMLDGGDCTLLYIYKREERTKADHTVALWNVDDIERTVDDLSKKGVEFMHYDRPGLKTDRRGIAEMNGSKSAWFKDTEGNILAVTSMS